MLTTSSIMQALVPTSIRPILLAALLTALCLPGVQAQPLRNQEQCWDTDIQTIQLRRPGTEMTEPVIRLGSAEVLQLSFDDLRLQRRFFRYKIILCDADWNESSLFFNEYLDGFAEDDITVFQKSFHSLVNYIHYTLQIPNDRMRIRLSGNYMLRVYSDDFEEPLFQRGFCVVETIPNLAVSARVNINTGVTTHPCAQQIELSVNYGALRVTNADREVKVRILQNGYQHPMVPAPKPVFLRGNSIDYTHIDQNLYSGVSEFRNFDISRLDALSLRLTDISVIDNRFHVRIDTDIPARQYMFQKDINGKFVIINQRFRSSPNTESDYPMVYFSLRTPPTEGTMYVFGAFTGYELSNRYAMLYSAERECYELAIPVKQGFYNYRYVYVSPGGDIDFNRVDNCSAESENIYGIYVYYRSPMDRHDRLMSVSWINSFGNNTINGRPIVF